MVIFMVTTGLLPFVGALEWTRKVSVYVNDGIYMYAAEDAQ